jgi:hypothetical protein
MSSKENHLRHKVKRQTPEPAVSCKDDILYQHTTLADDDLPGAYCLRLSPSQSLSSHHGLGSDEPSVDSGDVCASSKRKGSSEDWTNTPTHPPVLGLRSRDGVYVQ